MKYCPFLPCIQGEPSECLSGQCMLWHEHTRDCSLAERHNPDSRPVLPLPIREAAQPVECNADPVVTGPITADGATSDFDKWFKRVKTGGDGAAEEGTVADDSEGGEEYIGRLPVADDALFGIRMDEHEETEDLEDVDVEEQLADVEQITCAGCGRQLPKGAMWCPKCNKQPG